MPGLGEAGAEPAERLPAGRLGDAREGARDRLLLLVGTERVEPDAVGLVVAEDLPAELDGGADDLRVMVADVAVQGRAGADAVPAQDLHQPPDADPVAVVALRPGAHRGRISDRAAGLAGDAAAQREEFDVGDDPDRDPRPARPFELWPLVDRHIGKGSIVARLHDRILRSFDCDEHAKDRRPMAELRRVLGASALRDAAVSAADFRRRAALAVSRPRRPGSGGMAPDAAGAGGACRLSAPDPRGRGGPLRPGRGRRRRSAASGSAAG